MPARRTIALLTLLLLGLTALPGLTATPPAGRAKAKPRRTVRAQSNPAARADSVPVPAVATGAQVPIVHLSWHAPFGFPGASKESPASCDDSTGVDTLFISFEPTADDSSFSGLAGELDIYAQGSDTLGSFWDVGGAGANPGGIVVQWAPHADFPGEAPFDRGGMAAVKYERTSVTGRLRFFNVVPAGTGLPVKAHHRYTLGAVFIKPAHRGLTGCGQPVCLELGMADFVFNGKPDVYEHGSEMASRAGASCARRAPVWRLPSALADKRRAAKPDSTARH